MTTASTAALATVPPMRMYVRLLLVPFWLIGFGVGVLAVVLLICWNAASVGYRDARDRYGANR